MKILLNRTPRSGPWGGGNLFVQAFFRYAGQFGLSVTTDFGDGPDAVLIIDPRYDELGISINEIVQYRDKNPAVKIIQRVNECDARKGTNEIDDLLRKYSYHNHMTIFVSDWIKQYHHDNGWLGKWAPTTERVVLNGVDKTIFRPILKKNTKTNIVTHHWSNNDMKGADVHSWLDNFVSHHPQFSYTYIGRTKCQLKNSTHIQPLSGQALGDELAKHDIYITGTLHDPGPNHVIEALACGLPTYACRDGGGAVEFVGKQHVYYTFDDLEAILLSGKFLMNEWMPGTWEQCISEYASVIKEITNG